MRKRMCGLVFLVLIVCTLGACGKDKTDEAEKVVKKKPSLDTSSYYSFNLEDSTLIKDYKVAMLSQSDKQDNIYVSADKGLQRLKERLDCEIEYDVYGENDFENKVKELVDKDCRMIWVLGDKAADINTIAKKYPKVNFAVADEYYETIEKNVVLINFKISEASFLEGYVAGLATTTNVVAIEYVKSDYSDECLYGYKAGVDYAAKETGKTVAIETVEVADGSDIGNVNTQTTTLFEKNCDVIYAADKDIEVIVAEAVKDTDKYIIGISDHASLIAANNTLTYPVKYVDSAVELVSFHAMSGNDIAGVAYEYGMSEGALDIADLYGNVSAVIDSQLGSLKEVILGGEFNIPYDETTYNEYSTNM